MDKVSERKKSVAIKTFPKAIVWQGVSAPCTRHFRYVYADIRRLASSLADICRLYWRRNLSESIDSAEKKPVQSARKLYQVEIQPKGEGGVACRECTQSRIQTKGAESV